MHRKVIPQLLLATASVCGAMSAQAQPTLAGEQVYQQVCAACHAAGVAGAPKFGDRKSWAPLIKEGQAKLTADGWIGVRGMPPKGGKPDLALEDFSRATAHMARAAGATWKDPDAAMMASIRKKEKERLASLKAKK